jgi:hypothetical protein
MCFVQMNLLRAATTNTWGEFSPPPQTQYQLHISPTVPYSHLTQLYSLALAALCARALRALGFLGSLTQTGRCAPPAHSRLAASLDM